MNQFRFRTKATSSPCSTEDDDDEDWSTDESSEASSFRDDNNSARDRPIRPSNDRRNQENPEAYSSYPEKKNKKKQRRKDFQFLPLVPYIDEGGSQDHHPYHQTPAQITKHTTPRHRQTPLIEIIQNEWQYARSKPHHGDLPNLEQILSAPKVRRWGLVGFLFWCLVWVNWRVWARARWREHTLFRNAVSGGELKAGFGSFGTNMRPEFGGMVHLRSLGYEFGGDYNRSRLVVVGDVHGCIDELLNLLTEVSYNADHDHVICAGDMISKGPSSGEVIKQLISMKASCVRGNHEDRILLTHQGMKSHGLISTSFRETEQQERPSSSGPEDSEKPPRSQKTAAAFDNSHRGESAERDLASSLSQTQIQYLSSCPVILRLGPIPEIGDALVVHGGLVPGVDLEKQDPVSVMNMRTLDLETRVPSRSAEGTAWNELWTKYQTYLPPANRSTVIYGHDSRRGLQLTKYTKGLDTGCFKGGRLTALVVRYDGTEPTIVSVKCKDYRFKKAAVGLAA